MNLELARSLNQDIPSWWPNWHGETCVIIAGGPSAKDQDYDLVRASSAKVIAINNAYQLAPWADILFACDLAWWKQYGAGLDFKGLRLSTDRQACDPKLPFDVRRVMLDRPSDRLNLVRYNHVGWGGNSGFQALNLAIQFGAIKIVLVGYDMTVRYGLHWHGAHPRGMSNPTEGNILRWRKAVDNAADDIAKLGINVINASSISELARYPKMSLKEALA